MNPFRPFSLNIKGRLIQYDRPAIMGIINVTPDSFYAGSRTHTDYEISRRTELFIRQGVDIIDLGGYSSRPGADDIPTEEEIQRLRRGMEAIRSVSRSIPVSVDTFRSAVAREAIERLDADIINDITGGDGDPDMYQTVAELQVPYIVMHMRGTPETMQSFTDYDNVTVDVVNALSQKLTHLEELGVNDVIVDPGFGFSKTPEQNYALLTNLDHISSALARPILVGISRKSMLTRILNISPESALAATTAANTIAMMKGASILRVHDVEAAAHARAVTELTVNPATISRYLL